MSERPKTMSLDPNEWRALVINNLVVLHQFITGSAGKEFPNAPLNDAEGIWFQNQLDRLKYQVSAWQASARPVEPQTIFKNTGAVTPSDPVTINGNGLIEPKKRGRPKGSGNKPKKRQVHITAQQ